MKNAIIDKKKIKIKKAFKVFWDPFMIKPLTNT